MTFASTSQMYATSEFGSRAKFCAWTVPRPLTPMTATRTVSFGERPVRSSSAPSPAAVVCFTKSLRSMPMCILCDQSELVRTVLFQDSYLDVPEPHHRIVILQHDLPFAALGEPGRILRVLALRER